MKKNFTKMILFFFVSMLTVGAWAQTPDKDYLCITAKEAGATVQLLSYGYPETVYLEYYCTSDDKPSWNRFIPGTDPAVAVTLTNKDDKVYFRNAYEAKDVTDFSKDLNNYYYFTFTKEVSASGNVMSLVDKNVERTTIPCDYCFCKLFDSCTSLTDVTDLKLPATTLKAYCYRAMFQGCSALTVAPALPATTLAENCYYHMFLKCTALKTAPAELPAETLAENCYHEMFSGCTALETAPALPATTLANKCYYYMFYGCTSLTAAPALPATTLKDECYSGMFSCCKALEKAPELPAETLAKSCYSVMFNECYKLNYVKVGFSEWNDATSKWLCDAGTEATNHVFACPEELNVTTRDDSHVPDGWTITHPLLDYLCISAEEAGATVELIKYGNPEKVTIQYSTDNGASWQTVDFSDEETTEEITLTKVGDKVYFRNAKEAEKVTTFSHAPNNYYYFTFEKKVSVSGNVMSLIDKHVKTTTIKIYCFNHLFKGCETLTNAADLRLPAKNLEPQCYEAMFEGCTSLTSAPALPATTLARYCYCDMFKDCSSLTSAPALPATTLASDCYYRMFQGCSALEKAPELPATTLLGNCYYEMFKGCIKLNYVKVDFTDWNNATSDWLFDAGAEATNRVFDCPEELNTETRGASTIPEGWKITHPLLDYLCFTAQKDGAKVQLNKFGSPEAVTIEYSTNGGASWTTVDYSSAITTGDITLESIGAKVYFRNAKKAEEVKGFSIGDKECYIFRLTNVSASGNVMSLVDKNVESTAIPCDYCFCNLFDTCMSLTDLTDLKLPATTLAENCYYGMFNRCAYLTSAPELPATTLAASCYEGMFLRCTALKTAPALPATTLAASCYKGMFQECSALEKAPELPATTLAASCYEGMFYNCTALTAAPELPATTLATSCYEGMFLMCFTLKTAPALPSTTLAENCYYEMFKGCISLTSAPALPSTTLVENCYYEMFNGCTALTAAPALPSTTLAASCYKGMFQDCSALETAPELPATTLAANCYCFMFLDCKSLTTVPTELPATTLADSCYYGMFYNCTALTAAPALPATTLAENCYYEMFRGCTALETAPALPATTLAEDCYGHMFHDCSALTVAPDLPATTLANYCYEHMFNKCTNLKEVKVCFTDWDWSHGGKATHLWLNEVASTGTFCCPNELNIETRGASTIPEGWEITHPLFDYLCFTAQEDGATVQLNKVGSPEAVTIEYSTDECAHWTAVDFSSTTTTDDITLESIGSKVYFRNAKEAKDVKKFSIGNDKYYNFKLTKNVSASGNVMSLIDKNVEITTLPNDYCFYKLFFECSTLTTTPVLPAENLKKGCYFRMFEGCSALEKAPELPAETLAEECYYYMFQNCTSLNYVKAEFKDWELGQFTLDWLTGVASTGTFCCPNELNTETRGSSTVPEGWTIKKSSVEIDDAEPYLATTDAEYEKVTYSRTFKETGKYEALYLPFSVTMTSDLLSKITVSKIYMVSTKGSVAGGTKDSGVNVVVVKILQEGETTNPHTPYFIRSEVGTELEFIQDNTTLYAATNAKPGHIDCSTTMDKYDFIGTYTSTTMSPAEDKSIYVLQGGALHKVTTETELPCNRWQMVKTPRSWTETPVGIDAQEKMQIVTLGEDDTTGIDGLTPTLSEGEGVMYNLQGQRVKSLELRAESQGFRGIVICNGKKYIMK